MTDQQSADVAGTTGGPIAPQDGAGEAAEAPTARQDEDGPDQPDVTAGDGHPRPEGTKDAFVYATDFDPGDLNDAHALVVMMVGEGMRVLEIGCAEGSTTRVLQSRGCRVTGIEIDPAAAASARHYAEKVIVDDLDTIDFHQALGDERFDAIIAADVLEHLRDPIRCVRSCIGLLAPGGVFVLSIPNIAHADVRLALADGHFDYREWGLLDDTHLRFFTRATLLQFLDTCGLTEVEMRRVIRPMGKTELAPSLDTFPELVDHLLSDPEAQTYQFVLRAAPIAHDPHLADVARDRDRLRTEAEQLRATVRDLEGYRAAHRRLMHLLCPDLLDGDIVGPCGSSAKEKVLEVERAARLLLDEREAQRTEVETLLDAAESENAARLEAAETYDRMCRDLAEFRRSETYRVGRVVLSPAFAARRAGSRVVRAWRRSGEEGSR